MPVRVYIQVHFLIPAVPNEITDRTISHLDFKTILKLTSLSRAWQNYIKNDFHVCAQLCRLPAWLEGDNDAQKKYVDWLWDTAYKRLLDKESRDVLKMLKKKADEDKGERMTLDEIVGRIGKRGDDDGLYDPEEEEEEEEEEEKYYETHEEDFTQEKSPIQGNNEEDREHERHMDYEDLWKSFDFSSLLYPTLVRGLIPGLGCQIETSGRRINFLLRKDPRGVSWRNMLLTHPPVTRIHCQLYYSPQRMACAWSPPGPHPHGRPWLLENPRGITVGEFASAFSAKSYDSSSYYEFAKVWLWPRWTLWEDEGGAKPHRFGGDDEILRSLDVVHHHLKDRWDREEKTRSKYKKRIPESTESESSDQYVDSDESLGTSMDTDEQDESDESMDVDEVMELENSEELEESEHSMYSEESVDSEESLDG